MTRVRTDNVFGTLTDNPLTNVATTMNSAGLANLAVVSSAEAIIILDPNRVSGAPEIVVVTAHTGSATSATIQRGQFGTAARQHAQGTEWVHGPIASNASAFTTAADDQGDFVPMNAWEDYTPTLTQSGAVTKTVNFAKFIRIGRTIHARVRLTATGAGTAGNAVRVGLPVTAAAAASVPLGHGMIFDGSATTRYAGTWEQGTTTAGELTTDATGGATWGTTPSIALANGDVITASFCYEAAT